MRRFAALTVALSMGGCHARGDGAAGHTGATATPLASNTPADSSALTDPCEGLRRGEGLGASDGSDEVDPQQPRFECDRATGWAVRFDTDVDAGQATFAAVRARAGSPRWSAPPTRAQSILWPPTLEVHDFDGDGDPELFATAEYGAGAREWVLSRVFVTFKNGHVTPYAPAAGLPVDHLEDVDQDGRPDLVLEYEVGFTHRCDEEGRVPKLVTLVAHTRSDGTFSLSDAVARSELAKRFKCVGLPARVVKLPADVNDAISEKPIVCARLWGASQEEVLAEIERVCAPYAAKTAACRGPCRYIEDMRDLARFDPPMTLSGEP